MSEITKKQLDYIKINHIEDILYKIGLDASDLTKEQAIKIIAKHKETQFKHKETSTTNIPIFSSADFDKLLGRSPDYEKYPGCGYDRSWCG